MFYKKVVWLTLFIIITIFVACAPREAVTTAPAQKEVASKLELSALSPWEREWQQLIQAARKEGIVNLYVTWSADERQAIIDAFKKELGVGIAIVIGKGGEIAEKVITEHRYGLYIADVYIGGPTTQFNVLKPAGVTEPMEPIFIHPDLTDPQRIREAWYGGELGWLDNEHYLITFTGYPTANLALNTRFARPEELSSYKDLLNPKWKGKISWNDPTVTGSGAKTFTFFLEHAGGLDFIQGLLKQNITIVRDQRLQVEWLAQGKHAIAISAKTSTVEEAIRAEVPLAWHVPKEGTYLSVGGGTMSLIKKAPHPNATKLFINWLLTREVQTLFSKISGRQSRRTDVPAEHLDYPREPGKKYVILDTAEGLPRQAKHIEMAGEIFKHVLR